MLRKSGKVDDRLRKDFRAKMSQKLPKISQIGSENKVEIT